MKVSLSPLRIVLLGVYVIAAGFLLWFFALRSDVSESQQQVLSELEAVASEEADTSEPAVTNQAEDSATTTPSEADEQADDGPEVTFPAVVDNAIGADERAEVEPVTFELIETLSHDTAAFTQGLELSDGRLFESTGLFDQSSLRELDPETGEVIRLIDVPEVFAEGITVVEEGDGATVLQLSWLAEQAFRYDRETFEVVETYSYEGQGWGLCHDEQRLVMSNGSSTLQFRDVDDFSLLGTVDVTFAGAPIEQLNELECVDGRVWANIWMSSLIVEIDPSSGNVTRVLDASSLTPPGFENSTDNVLNGIAYDAVDDTYLITGKRWPDIFRIRIN